MAASSVVEAGDEELEATGGSVADDTIGTLASKPIGLRRLLSRAEIKRLSGVEPRYTVLKLTVYTVAFISCWATLLMSGRWPIIAVATFCLGVVYAHGLELQHQCLHHKLLSSRRWSRVVGFVLGAPMLVSYTHYRAMHLHHHKFLGTPTDAEIFNYDQSSLDSWPKFLLRAWNVARLPTFFVTLFGFLRGRYPRQFSTPVLRRQLTVEYVLLLVLLVAGLAASWALRTPTIGVGWFCAWLFVGEPVHFLIELPEHIGCDRSTPNIFANTRSVVASPLLQYITNRNNYHVEHHLYPAICPSNLHLVHEVLKPYIVHHDTYPRFFLKLFNQIGKQA